MFLSQDIVSLFIGTPINEILDIIKKQIEADIKLKLQTNLNVDDVMELLKFIVTTTYFSFWGSICQQKFGTAMGDTVCPSRANTLKAVSCQQQRSDSQMTTIDQIRAIPKDRGWAWMCLIGGLLMNTIMAGGIFKTFGVIFTTVEAKYYASAAFLSWTPSIAVSLAFLMDYMQP
ncbi:hypothetical protein LSAT2_027403 [Lamellibrachia satsuma]|nr:hypothetical protein LSAT2_027403 [Lamellibrachia satsuma]